MSGKLISDLHSYGCDWQNQPHYVQHPVPHSGFVEGVSQGLIVTEESPLVGISPQEKE